MDLANEYMISASGWTQFDEAPKDQGNAEYLEFAHKVARVFGTPEGKEVLDAMVKKYLLTDIANATDTQVGIGIKQGRASVVKQILAQIEISNKTT